MNRGTGSRIGAGMVLAALAMSAACSSGGNAPEPRSEEPTIEPTSTVRVDPSTAVRLRELADASVQAAVRTFGPAEGLPLDELGARLFRTRGCIECHGPGDLVGPNLIDAFGTMRPVAGMRPLLMDLDYINVALMRPDSLIAEGYQPGIMPSYEKSLYPREVLALAVYLQGMSERPRLAAGGPDGDVDPTPVAVDDADAPPPTPVNRVEAPLIPAAPAVEEGTQPETRDDSRPDWWFDGVRREEGRVWMCAEALGDSFGATRSAVIERGQAALSERMGLGQGDELRDVRVKYIQMIPLPNRGVEQRYAGYVLISAVAN